MVALVDLILPRRCAGCGTAGAWLCDDCRAGCDAEIVRCSGVRGRAAGVFAGPLREAIHAFKYSGEHALANELGDLVARLVAADLAAGILLDAIVPVPLHRARVRQRGYDQALLLATRVAGSCGLPLIPALRRIRWERPQVDLDRTARLESVHGAFVGIAASLAGLRVALVDDVTTTGATLRAAAAAARACGARATRAYVVASDL